MTASPSRYPLTTSLNRIWACDPCEEGKVRALKVADKDEPDDEPITYAAIIEAVGEKDALWCTQVEPQYDREWRLFAVWCARRVQYLLEDPSILCALDIAEWYANGHATDEDLATAKNAASIAAISATGDAIRDAAWAVAWAATGTTTRKNGSIAGGAAHAAARAVASASAAGTGDAIRAAAWAVAWAAQRLAFIQLVTTGTLP